jgi:integrase/recombinase XerD
MAVRDSGVSPISCNTYCRTIYAYLRWLHEEGHKNDLLRIAPMKTEKKVLATFTRSQVDLFLRWKPRTFSEFRLHTLVALLLDTGLRIAEALELRRDQFDWDNLLVKVRGKGQKQRLVPFSLELRKVLFRRSENTSLPWRSQLGKYVAEPKEYARRAETPWEAPRVTAVRVSFHTFRHTFAVSYLRAGGNLYYLARVLGHSSV